MLNAGDVARCRPLIQIRIMRRQLGHFFKRLRAVGDIEPAELDGGELDGVLGFEVDMNYALLLINFYEELFVLNCLFYYMQN